ncbi:MAG: amidohydrolase family protein [Spirochaetes bacterium]|nr:amidohydrolase family protein [Spirochaetota bacterium]
MDRAFRNIASYTGLGLEKISRFVSENPARMLGLFDRTGSIAEGKAADTIVTMTMARGVIAYRRP